MLVLRRALIHAAFAVRTAVPVAVVLSAPLIVACGGGGKAPAKPVDKGPAKVSNADVLAEARAAAKANDVTTAHAKYQEAEKLDLQFAVVEEHVKFLLASNLPDPAVETAKHYYETKLSDTKGFLLYANTLIGAGDFATAIEVTDNDASRIDDSKSRRRTTRRAAAPT